MLASFTQMLSPNIVYLMYVFTFFIKAANDDVAKDTMSKETGS